MRCVTWFFLFLFYTNLTVANVLKGPPLAFNIKAANQQFDHINLQLSVQNLNLSDLNRAVDTLNELTAQSNQCQEDVQKKLTNIEGLIKQSGTDKEHQNNADVIYLANQQRDLQDEQAQCRLFSIRATEAIDAYKTAIAHMKQEKALTRGMPIWKMVNQIISTHPNVTILPATSVGHSSLLLPLGIWMSLTGILLLGSTALLLKVKSSHFVKRHLKFRKINLGQVVLLTAFFMSGILIIYLLTTTEDASLNHPIFLLSSLLFFYLLSFITTLFIFKFKRIRVLFYWYQLDKDFFQAFTITLLSFYALAAAGFILAPSFNNSPLWQLCQSIFILLTLITGIHFIYYFCREHRSITFVKHHYRLIQRLGLLLFMSYAITNMLGYCDLSMHLTFSTLLTLLIIFITYLITHGINKLYLMLTQQPTLHTKIIKYFGYRMDQTLTEFLILKTISQLIVVALSIYLIGQSLEFATNFLESFYDQLLHGLAIANIVLYPTRILSGMVVFCLLYLLFRTISTHISRHQQFEDEEETQVAVASILTYIGFTLAVVVGLLVAGFDFTGLTIIAGALSVGIGLGLQSIVNNFVSGLILLIEKPIRPGDRINVDGIEGFVKKIRVRSTQIMTPSREDIIIPNSDLITRPVTNYMFSDKYCRVQCLIGVAYGSDTHLVHDILLDIALNHEEVIKTGRSKPIVLFHSFADNTMMFQLNCLIKDVNKKSLVQSELHFAIEKAFRDHNIEMPFPQREIHLKWDELAPVMKMKTTEPAS